MTFFLFKLISIFTARCCRDDLELVDISVQTDLLGDTRDQWTQTEDLLSSGLLADSQSKVIVRSRNAGEITRKYFSWSSL